MNAAFDREALLDAFDQIGRAAVQAGTKLQIAVYGGSALMLASNFRFATEDVDIADIGQQWPEWLSSAVERVMLRTGILIAPGTRRPFTTMAFANISRSPARPNSPLATSSRRNGRCVERAVLVRFSRNFESVALTTAPAQGLPPTPARPALLPCRASASPRRSSRCRRRRMIS